MSLYWPQTEENKKRLCITPRGEMEAVTEWVLETEGSDLLRVLSDPEVDTCRTSTNHIVEVFLVSWLCWDVCRQRDCMCRVVVCWLLNVPATCWCISGTDLLKQFYVLPHWDGSCRSNFPSHPVTIYWLWANQSQHWPYNTRCLAG